MFTLKATKQVRGTSRKHLWFLVFLLKGVIVPDIFINNKKNKEPASDKKALKKISELQSQDPNHSHTLSSFCTNPVGISFQSQEPDEKILLFLRRHFITNVPWIFITLILVLIPPSFTFFNISLSNFIPIDIPAGLTFIIILFYYLAVFSYAFISFITWYYNISIVTQKRIVDIDFSELIYHDVAATKLSQIEDTNYTKIGFIRALFNYGDAFAQTAGEKNHFDFLAIPQPARAVRIIVDLIGRKFHGH